MGLSERNSFGAQPKIAWRRYRTWTSSRKTRGQPTREMADLLTRKRELLDTHFTLRKLGR